MNYDIPEHGNVAFNVDCLDLMRSLPDKYFDLAVCDPPYGLSITGSTHTHTHIQARRLQQAVRKQRR